MRRIVVKQPLTFSKEEVKDASLTCSTEIPQPKFEFGFTAENIFYRSNSMEIKQLKFFHDQKKIGIITSYKSGKEVKMEIKYLSFCNLNFEIFKKNENFDVNLIINVTHTALFGTEIRQGYGTKYVRVNPIEDEGDRKYWKTFVQSTAFRLSFNLETSAMFSLLNQLYQNIPCGLTFTSVKVAVIDPTSFKDLGQFIGGWDWNIRYDVECIKQCGIKGAYFLEYVLFKRNRMATLTEDQARDLFRAMYDHLKGDPTLTSLEFVDSVILTDHEDDGDDNYVLVKTVYVTPTRIIPIPDEWTLDSRGLRYLGVDNVVQVKFRDENLSWFPHDLGSDIITPTCRNGIAIANRIFHEFGGSNSSFREFSSYFYATEDKDQILQMYKKLGTFEPATAAKLSARIGQYFTSAWVNVLVLQNICIVKFLEDKNAITAK
jgi:hypothetical protein